MKSTGMARQNEDKAGEGAGRDGAAAAPVAVGRFGGIEAGGELPAEINDVGKFLQRRVLIGARDATEGGNMARLVIRHVVNGRIGDRVDGAKVDEIDKLTPERVRALAIEIYKCAATHAENAGRGEQRYRLEWYDESDPGEDPFAHPFTVRTGRQVRSADDGDQWVDSYPPTDQGVSSMLMRRIESLDDKFIELMEAVIAPFGIMRDQLNDVYGELKTLRAERRADAAEVDAAKAAVWDRNERSLESAAKREVYGELAKGVRVVIPAVAKRVGLIDKDQPIDADSAHVLAMVESIVKRGGLDAILSSDLLNDEEKGHIVSTVTAHLAVDEKGGVVAVAPTPVTAAEPAARPGNGARPHAAGNAAQVTRPTSPGYPK